MPTVDMTIPHNIDKLLDEARPALAAMNGKQLAARKISRDRVLELTGVLLSNFPPIDEQLEVELSPERAVTRREQAVGLKLRAWVYVAADLQADELFSDTIKQERDALAVSVAAHDQMLMKWAIPLFDDNPQHVETLRDIQRKTGRRDDAEDVLRLVRLFRDNWKLAEGNKKLTLKMLDTAATEAATQLELLESSKANPARDVAARAYTAWAVDYGELVAMCRYLTRHDEDSVARFPGIHSAANPGRARSAGKVEGEGEPVVEGEGEGEGEPAEK
jgi:hypothetical protein